MADVIEIFDIEDVEQIYQNMDPLRSFPPEELKKQFVANYLIKQNEGIDPIRLNMIIKAYHDHKLGTRYLIDRNDPLIEEVYQACRNQSR
jgi:hypothetical protein